jgi:hypothetical protein
MALVTEEQIQSIWRPLEGNSIQDGWRSIAIAEHTGCRIRAAKSSPDNAEALLIGFPSVKLPPANQLPSGHGFKVIKTTLGDVGHGFSWLALVRQPAGSLDMFGRMVVDVMTTVEESVGVAEAVLYQRYLGRIRAWQDFMRRGREGLSSEEELGLVGELTVLAQLINIGLPLFTAIESWKGPHDGLQDFELGSGSVEVKSTLAGEGFSATIDSLEQLDDSSRYPLFLAAVKFHLSEEGRSLPQYVDDIREALDSDPAALRAFNNCLMHSGYIDVHKPIYTRTFAVTKLNMHAVDDNFPRLTLFNVPAGVAHARYNINLELAQSKIVSLEQALTELGAL